MSPFRLLPPECSTFPHIIHLITSGASLLVFVACALLNLGADFELSPLDKGYLAIANAGVEMHVSAQRTRCTMQHAEGLVQFAQCRLP